MPAPLIRVREGTAVVVRSATISTHSLTVHGLCARDGQRCAPIDVPPADTREVRFTLDRAGTYHYWATTTGMPLAFRGAPDTQLSGALVVDPAQGATEADRVLVITDWTSLTREQLKTVRRSADDPGAEFSRINPRLTFLINGLSWPATERLTYRVGEKVRWRVVNLSSQRHPMHMHGFYYEVDSLGDGLRDTAYAVGQQAARRHPAAATRRDDGDDVDAGARGQLAVSLPHHAPRVAGAAAHRVAPIPTPVIIRQDDESAGMAGLILGVTVLGPNETAASAAAGVAPRRLTLTMRADPTRGPAPVYGFALTEGNDAPPDGAMSVPGPTLVLRRGEPVEITLVNRLPEGTAIHWHGMELDSYYDGVHGWSGVDSRVTPLIEPGGTFVVRLTPPRTGTFIYHTHLHDHRQLPSGLYGALLVVDPGTSGETYDPSTDHVFVIGGGTFAAGGGNAEAVPPLLNGERDPQFVWKSGTRHRVRLINITTDDIFTVSLMTSEGPVTWRPLTKDGASLPPARCVSGAARQTIAVGETYDFEVQTPPGRQTLWLEVRTTGGSGRFRPW